MGSFGGPGGVGGGGENVGGEGLGKEEQGGAGAGAGESSWRREREYAIVCRRWTVRRCSQGVASLIVHRILISGEVCAGKYMYEALQASQSSFLFCFPSLSGKAQGHVVELPTSQYTL